MKQGKQEEEEGMGAQGAQPLELLLLLLPVHARLFAPPVGTNNSDTCVTRLGRCCASDAVLIQRL